VFLLVIILSLVPFSEKIYSWSICDVMLVSVFFGVLSGDELLKVESCCKPCSSMLMRIRIVDSTRESQRKEGMWERSHFLEIFCALNCFVNLQGLSVQDGERQHQKRLKKGHRFE
jgi:hypothetical protein